MKKHRCGSYGPDDLDSYTDRNKEKAIEVYKRKYAGKLVTIYYNPDNIEEFYVKEIEEDLMLRDFRDFKNTKKYKSFMYGFKKLIIFCAICIGIYLLIRVLSSIMMNCLIEWINTNYTSK